MPSAMLEEQAAGTLLAKLRCPECRQGMLRLQSETTLDCASCGQEYPVVQGVPLLFAAAELEQHVRRDQERDTQRHWAGKNRGGAYHWREYQVWDHLPDLPPGAEVLLLGCGDAGERSHLHERGYRTTAFDIVRSSGTDFVADAHRLPLADATFDLVLSMQVLEHLHSPWIAAQEIARVLKPGGWFVGSVAFLKAYHGSYFHMTHLGVTHLLGSFGLKVDRLSAAQSMTYMLYGALVPLGTRGIRRRVYPMVDRFLHAIRARLWSRHTRLHPDQPTDRFHTEIPVSFRAFDRLRFAPTVVFRARKSSVET